MKLFIILSLLMVAVSVQAGWFDDATDWIGNAAETVGDVAVKAKDKVVEHGGKIGEVAVQAKDKVVEHGSAAGNWAKNVTLDDIVSGAKNTGAKVGETASDVYTKVANQFSQPEEQNFANSRK